MSKKKQKQTDFFGEDKKFPLPVYNSDADIYNNRKQEILQDEENSRLRRINKKDKSPGADLDIPGSELDDVNEDIGEEDEENNYYSLGGDNHEDLENDIGD